MESNNLKCDQIWRFFKFLVKNILTKVAQIFGYFDKHYFFKFFAKFWKHMGYFLFQHLVTLAT